jgi:hypothetical protein
VILAHVFSGFISNPRYRFNANQFKDVLDFNCHPLVFSDGFVVGSYCLPCSTVGNCGAERYDLQIYSECRRIIFDIANVLEGYEFNCCSSDQDRYLIIDLPFDQHPGRLARYLLRHSIRSDLNKCIALTKPDICYNIAIHVRAGDVTIDNDHSWMFLSLHTLIEVLEQIAKFYSTTEKHRICGIVLCSQLVITADLASQLRDVLGDIQLLIVDPLADPDGYMAIKYLLFAKAVISGGSSFPYYCSYFGLSKHLCLIDNVNRASHHRFDSHSLIYPRSKEGVEVGMVKLLSTL